MSRETTIQSISSISQDPWVPYVRIGKVEERDDQLSGKAYGELWIPANCLAEFQVAAANANRSGDGQQSALDAQHANSQWAKRAIWMDATPYYLYAKLGPEAKNIRLICSNQRSERHYQCNVGSITPVHGEPPSHEWLQKVAPITAQILAHKLWHVAVNNHRCGAAPRP